MTLEDARSLIEQAKSRQSSMADAIEQIFDFDDGLSPRQRETLASELDLFVTGKAKTHKLQWQQQLGIETDSERRERITTEAATRGLTVNKYHGRCVVTGEKVEKGEGFARKGANGKSWEVLSFGVVADGRDETSVLASVSDEDLLAEAKKRGLI